MEKTSTAIFYLVFSDCLVQSAFERAVDILPSARKQLEEGAKLLLEKETLNEEYLNSLQEFHKAARNETDKKISQAK